MTSDAPVRKWHPNDEDDYEALNADLKRRFRAWSAEKGLDVDPESPESPLHYKWAYLDGHLTRWRCADLDEIYLELYPARVIVEPAELDDVLDEARAIVTFLAEIGLLDAESDPPDVLVGHLSDIERRFRAHMAEPARQSFGKRLWVQALKEGSPSMDSLASRGDRDIS